MIVPKDNNFILNVLKQCDFLSKKLLEDALFKKVNNFNE